MENTVLLSPPPLSGTPQESGSIYPDVLPGMTGRTVRRETDTSDTPEPPRTKRRSYPRRRFGVPVAYSLVAAAGAAAGVFFAASAPEGTDFSESLLCCSGDFFQLMMTRLLWGLSFLALEYISGYFALGKLLVWLLPLACGLGTGAALTGAFAVQGAAALRLIPTCIMICAAVIGGARISGDMSSQLLRLVSSGRNSVVAVVSDSPAAGEYTLRFIICFAVTAGCAVSEAAVRAFT